MLLLPFLNNHVDFDQGLSDDNQDLDEDETNDDDELNIDDEDETDDVDEEVDKESQDGDPNYVSLLLCTSTPLGETWLV